MPRQRLLGQQLGRSVANTREDLFAKFREPHLKAPEAEEAALRAVTEKATDTFYGILKQCSTGGRPWKVKRVEPPVIAEVPDGAEPPVRKEPDGEATQATPSHCATLSHCEASLASIPDYDLIVKYYAAGPRQR